MASRSVVLKDLSAHSYSQGLKSAQLRTNNLQINNYLQLGYEIKQREHLRHFGFEAYDLLNGGMVAKHLSDLALFFEDPGSAVFESEDETYLVSSSDNQSVMKELLVESLAELGHIIDEGNVYKIRTAAAKLINLNE